eukprot:TRINITY_DN1072_c0_g1_i1.p2 TRINITY_DN1072_c0_g1~~TRINITY_DN1072_c0_g1_i1.p2  ORF type:complete len:494 (+),score=140.30 TRINITY_DN1072_c0_g1_i1:36-1484(+)
MCIRDRVSTQSTWGKEKMSLSKGKGFEDKTLLYLGLATYATLGLYIAYDIWDKYRRRKAKKDQPESRPRLQSENEPAEQPELGEVRRKTMPALQLRHSSTGSEFPIFKICITGGPCAGKTSALSFLNEKLSERGFKVFTVPETPTLTMQGGGMIIMGNLTQDKIIRFQTLLIKTQMNMEDYFVDLAILNGQPAVVLCDRGVMDPSAYMTPEQFQALLDEQGWNKVSLRDRRYDLVIHMVTAADGAEEYYTLANNQARYENDLSVAIETDRKTQNAWVGHPHLMIIDNTTEKGFDKKLSRVLESIGKALGLPTASKFFRKFLIQIDAGEFKLPSDIRFERFQVEEMFLKKERTGATSSIRKRGQNGNYTYSQTTRLPPNEKGERVEIKRQLSAREYLTLYNQRDESLMILHKERITFLVASQPYILDIFLNGSDRLAILRVETDKSDTNLKLPPFLNINREVTHDDAFSSYAIAQRGATEKKQ